ncbi:MAG: polysaccharide deacetylase family protein [Bacteroidales bacterium]|nr:polysaccharide deacetylase family protein [Bacteroidales bacterium]
MKLRYFLATVLFLCIFCYGLIILITAMVDRATTPPETNRVAIVTDVQEGKTATPHTISSKTDTTKNVSEAAPEELQIQEQEPVQESKILQREGTPPSVEIIIIPQKPSQWGEATRGIVRRVNVESPANTKTLFLTINAYSFHQEDLIQELINHKVKATFFVSGYYVRRNQEAVKQIAANPLFDIENLGNRNRSLSVEGRSVYGIAGTTDRDDVMKEVADGAASIAAVTGKQVRYVRSATGYTDDVAVAVINAAGNKVIGYQTVTDGGGTLSSEEIKNRILQAENGSILVISINPNRPSILQGLKAALEEIKAKKLPLRFEKLIDHESAFEIIR